MVNPVCDRPDRRNMDEMKKHYRQRANEIAYGRQEDAAVRCFPLARSTADRVERKAAG
jgi:hypothetical protein